MINWFKYLFTGLDIHLSIHSMQYRLVSIDVTGAYCCFECIADHRVMLR